MPLTKAEFANKLKQMPETTSLTPDEEQQFQAWVKKSGVTDVDNPESHYDYRGFFKHFGLGGEPDTNGHFPDTFKQHGHPTFSDESQYATPMDPEGGAWNGDQLIKRLPVVSGTTLSPAKKPNPATKATSISDNSDIMDKVATFLAGQKTEGAEPIGTSLNLPAPLANKLGKAQAVLDAATYPKEDPAFDKLMREKIGPVKNSRTLMGDAPSGVSIGIMPMGPGKIADTVAEDTGRFARTLERRFAKTAPVDERRLTELAQGVRNPPVDVPLSDPRYKELMTKFGGTQEAPADAGAAYVNANGKPAATNILSQPGSQKFMDEQYAKNHDLAVKLLGDRVRTPEEMAAKQVGGVNTQRTIKNGGSYSPKAIEPSLGGGVQTQKQAKGLATVGKEVVDLTNANQGATYNLTNGNLSGTDNFAVSTFPDRTVTVNRAPNQKDVVEFARKNADLLKDPENSLGTWHDKAKNNFVLDVVKTVPDRKTADVVKTVPDRKTALALGQQHGQDAIFDLKNLQEIRLADEPTLALEHRSHVPGLTMSDPTKYGTGILGEEAKRSGLEGFLPRTYLSVGPSQEGAVKALPHGYEAKVLEALSYDLEKDPEGLIQQAQKIGGIDNMKTRTAFEKLVKDAGYRGYRAGNNVAWFEPVGLTPKTGK